MNPRPILLLLITFCPTMVIMTEIDLNMVEDIQHYFGSKWIIIQACNKIDYPIFKLMKDIGRKMGVYTSVYNWKDFFVEANFAGKTGFKPLALLSSLTTSHCLKSINLLNQHNMISKFIWLAIMDSGERIENGIDIPINALFISAVKNGSDVLSNFYVLKETYLINSEKIQTEIGHWSSAKGLNMVSRSIFSRRNDFRGQIINTLVEPPDSLNFMIAIYSYFQPFYYDFAKGLNFSVKNITDPKEGYEISVVMEWLDSMMEKVWVYPLWTSQRAIFFKNIGSTKNLDAYLQPFQKTVWVYILVMVFITGFFSYIVTNVLEHGSETVEKFLTSKVLTLSLWGFSMLIMTSYSAIFISFISVSIPKPPFSSLEELVSQDRYNIVTVKYITSGTIGYLQNHSDWKLRKLYKYHFDPQINIVEDALVDFCGGNEFLFITDLNHMKKVQIQPQFANCTYTNRPIRLNIRHMSWTANKWTPYEKFLRICITKYLYAGLLMDYLDRKTIVTKLHPPPTYTEITLHDVFVLFIILFIGYVLCFSIFLVELLSRGRNHITNASL